MRELTVDELNFVVGGTLPPDNSNQYFEQQYNILVDNYFQYGVGIVSVGDQNGLWELIRRIVERIFPPSESENRKSFMEHCAAQGKSAVFVSGGASLAATADPNSKTVKIEGGVGPSSQYCR